MDSTGAFSPSLVREIITVLRRDPKILFKALGADSLEVGNLIVSDKIKVEKGAVFTNVTAFTNSWVSVGSPYSPISYRKDPWGVVRLRGRLSTGTVGSAAFTLPPGFRPAATIAVSVISNATIGLVEVSTLGVVTPKTPSNNTYVSLDNISFFAEA